MSGSMSVTPVMRGSRQTRSSTGIPPLPAPTCSKCAMGPSFERMKDEPEQLITEPPFIHPSSFIVHPSLLRLGQRPLAGLVPDFIARQPAPGGLDGEDASEAGRVPAA